MQKMLFTLMRNAAEAPM